MIRELRGESVSRSLLPRYFPAFAGQLQSRNLGSLRCSTNSRSDVRERLLHLRALRPVCRVHDPVGVGNLCLGGWSRRRFRPFNDGVDALVPVAEATGLPECAGDLLKILLAVHCKFVSLYRLRGGRALQGIEHPLNHRCCVARMHQASLFQSRQLWPDPVLFALL